MLYRLQGGVVVEGLVDSTGDGKGDVRQGFEGGEMASAEVDTNGSGRADVVQYFAGGNIIRQCQDDDANGTVDACFEGEAQVPVSGTTELATVKELGCGTADRFWKRF